MMRLGVCGWPVAHSRSPQMHNAALALLGLHTGVTSCLPLPPHLFTETVRALPGAGFRGVNVTIPHKEQALALADSATETAKEIGAANTLTFEPDGAIHADNTDATGFLTALNELRLRPDRARARRRRVGPRGPLRAAPGRRPRGARLEPHTAIARRRSPTSSAPKSAPSPADIIVNCTSVGLANPETRSRRCRSGPMRWVPDARWWTWSTGTAAPSC